MAASFGCVCLVLSCLVLGLVTAFCVPLALWQSRLKRLVLGDMQNRIDISVIRSGSHLDGSVQGTHTPSDAIEGPRSFHPSVMHRSGDEEASAMPDITSGIQWVRFITNLAPKLGWTLDADGNFHALPKLKVPEVAKAGPKKCMSCDCSFIDEKNLKIKCDIEKDSRAFTYKYIPRNATTLEVGARYGTNSCAIAHMQGNSGKQVSIDADRRVWPALEMNKKLHHCKFNIVRGVLSLKDAHVSLKASFGTLAHNEDRPTWLGLSAKNMTDMVRTRRQVPMSRSKVPHVTLGHLEEQYGLRFDHAFFDCEGCAPYVFEDFPQLVEQLKVIILEVHDITEVAMVEKLQERGWKLVESADRHSVLKKM